MDAWVEVNGRIDKRTNRQNFGLLSRTILEQGQPQNPMALGQQQLYLFKKLSALKF